MFLSWIRNAQIRFPVLMTLLLFMGMMPNPGVTKIKCYDCDGGKDCEEGQVAKLQEKILTCNAVSCYTQTARSSSGTILRTKRGCNKEETAEDLKCITDIYGSLCSHNKDRKKFLQHVACVLLDIENELGRQDNGESVQTCHCESELCNHEKEIVKAEASVKAGAEHSFPNKKLVIFAISMMATVYLSVSQLN